MLITETQNGPLSRRGWSALQFAAADPAALPSTMSRGRARSLLRKLPIDHPPHPYGGCFVQTIQVTEVRAAAHFSGRSSLSLRGLSQVKQSPAAEASDQLLLTTQRGTERGEIRGARNHNTGPGPFHPARPQQSFRTLGLGRAVRRPGQVELQHGGPGPTAWQRVGERKPGKGLKQLHLCPHWLLAD